jgi:ionotropic glutamate receptor
MTDIPHIESRLDLDTGIKEFSINLYPAQTLLNIAFHDTMKFLNWTKVAIIYEQNYGLIKLRELMKTPDLEIIVRQADPQSYVSILNEIKSKEIHNLVIDTNPDHMNELLKGVSIF